MPPPNRPMTLQDLQRDGMSGGSSSDGPAAVRQNRTPTTTTAVASSSRKYAANTNNNNFHPPKINHIPSLPRSEEALTMLQRVVGEFLPIIQRRGYNVRSVSELCCCNDGLDFALPKRRKLRKAANNIWGYNRTVFGNPKSHTIHLRLRHVGAHTTRMHVYEDVAGTLAHELAHCEYSPHNDKFYKLMDDILDEHASLICSGMTFLGGQATVPAFGGTGHLLEGNDTPAGNPNQARLQAIEGRKLGGDGSFQQWKTPREAAAAAAVARHRQQRLRLRGNRCCRPCNVMTENNDNDDIIEINETDPTLVLDSMNQKRAAEENTDPKQQRKKRYMQPHDGKTALATSRKAAATASVIDLTESDQDEPESQWSCIQCTFFNPPSQHSCDMCNHPR